MDKLVAQWKKDERAIFRGWDFSYLKGRMRESKLPWDYAKLARRLISKSSAILDMETGGGEIFSSLAPFPKHAVAYEGYKPNIPIARRRLTPLGVEVVRADSFPLPFKDAEFDLVLNRHGAIDAAEIHRILKNGGLFLTQQVTGSDGLHDLAREFRAKRKFRHITLQEYEKQLRAVWFEISKSHNHSGKLVFRDVGAIVYYLKAIPWAVPGFSVEGKLSHLKKLQAKIEKERKLEFEAAKFMILARKPPI